MIVVTGASGQLGHAFSNLLGEDAILLDRASLDLTRPDRITGVIEELRPSLFINCAAYTAVDRAESEPEVARQVNADAVAVMARACASTGSRFVTFSTDYVFDGTKSGGYVESDHTAPINVYGRTKREGEVLTLETNPDALVVRTSWVMSGTHRSFASVMLDLIGRGDVKVIDDQRGRPTFVDDLASATMSAIDADGHGILHLTNSGEASWYEIALQIAELAGFDPDRVHACSTADYPTAAKRPENSVLDSERRESLGLASLPDYREALSSAISRLRASR
ncbi:MAG TPA: dTDP-4-dehydrorhamnose reductase [Acidimicrobiia bacterium]|nr:dTDP-4-dehydrorhamnose reductase [Acidimicrobiia bacterium]